MPPFFIPETQEAVMARKKEVKDTPKKAEADDKKPEKDVPENYDQYWSKR